MKSIVMIGIGGVENLEVQEIEIPVIQKNLVMKM